jgi:hypothetical protein
MAEIKSNAKLKNLPAAALDEMWLLRHPEEPEGKVFSFTEILGALPGMYGMTSSMAALSEFYSWLTLKRDLDDAIARSEQAQLEFLVKNPGATPEAMQAAGQIVFTSKTMQTGDVAGFVKLMDSWERRQQRIMDQEKWEEVKATKRRKEETEAAIRRINEDKTLAPDAQRTAVLDKMDEFFGLKKK